MSSIRHLGKAPVKEALIDCQFTGTWNREFFEVCSELAGTQGRMSDLFETSFMLTVNNEGGETKFDPSSNSKVGKRIDFDDARQVLQVQRTGFTFSQLEPYGSWEQIAEDAKVLWAKLSKNLDKLQVSRLAIRYINAIDLPLPFSDFNEYLSAAPHIPSEVPQGLSQFLIRTVSPVESDLVLVTQSLSPGDIHADRARVMLDIEVVCTDVVHLSGTNMASTLNRLRDRKNTVFFSYLTEKTLEMYK